MFGVWGLWEGGEPSAAPTTTHHHHHPNICARHKRIGTTKNNWMQQNILCRVQCVRV